MISLKKLTHHEMMTKSKKLLLNYNYQFFCFSRKGADDFYGSLFLPLQFGSGRSGSHDNYVRKKLGREKYLMD
jgi:hypothetical protein